MTVMRTMGASLAIAAVAGIAGLASTAAAETGKAIPEGAEVLRQGRLQGLNGHTTTGTVSLIERAGGGHAVVLHENFKLDGAPDPKLGFGQGKYRADNQFAPLRKLEGKQVYDVPEHVDATSYRTFWVWCEKFSVGLGRATLKP